MANFPSTLPNPSAAGFNADPDKAFIRTEFDSGSARHRQRYTATAVKVQLSWNFNAAMMAIFRTFFNDTIHAGTDWFTMDLNIGDGVQSYTVRFVEPYTASFSAFGWWSVAAKLEIENA